MFYKPSKHQSNFRAVIATCTALVGVASALAGPLVWEETYPVALRTGQTYATNPANGRLLMFGGGVSERAGLSATTQLGDLWEWDGQRWNAIPTSGPAPRADAAAAFDPTNGSLLLFGGQGSTADFAISGSLPRNHSDTWQLAGGRWTQVASDGPAAFFPSQSLTMAFNPVRGRMLLNVRASSNTPESTWEWDNGKWVLRSQGEIGAFRTAMAYDAAAGRVISISLAAEGAPRITQQWTGTQWENAPASDPEWVDTRALLGDVTTGRVYLIASTTTLPRGLWRREAGVWTRLLDVPSLPNPGLNFAWDSINQTVLCMARNTPELASHKTLLLRNGVWEAAAAVGPGARVEPGVTFDPVRNVTTVYGSSEPRNGIEVPAASRSQTWEHDGTTWTLKGTNAQPVPPSSFARTFFDPDLGVTVAAFLSRNPPVVWDWNGSAWAQRATNTPPQRRSGAIGVFHNALGAAVFAGGVPFLADPPFNASTWILSGGTWTELAVPGPSPRTAPFIVYDEFRQKIVLFGGTGPTSFNTISETWEFDGASWTQVAVGTSPPKFLAGTQYPTFYTSMAYDAARRRTVLLESPVYPGIVPPPGVLPATAAAAVWEWDGTTWTRRQPSHPLRPAAMTRPSVSFFFGLNHLLRRLAFTPGFTTAGHLAYDPQLQRCLLWGGENLVMDGFYGPLSVSPSSLHELPDSTVIASPCARITVVAGRAVQIEGRIAMDNASYHWLRNGIELAASERLLGERTESIVIRDARKDDAGEYTLVATSPSGETLATLPCTLLVRSPADFNDDGRVDTKDLMRLLGAFGSSDPRCAYLTHDIAADCIENLTLDAVIDTRDLTRFLGEMARFGAAE